MTIHDYNAIAIVHDNTLPPVNIQPKLADRLTREFFNQGIHETYPLDLFFAVADVDKRTFVNAHLLPIIAHTPLERRFDGYANEVFGRFRVCADGLSGYLSNLVERLGKRSEVAKRRADVIKERYIKTGRLQTLEVVGRNSGVSRGRAEQLEKDGIKSLKRRAKRLTNLAEQLFSLPIN